MSQDGDCLQSITRCDKWENECEDGEKTTVCVDFHTEDIPDQCLIMELVCDTTSMRDQE